MMKLSEFLVVRLAEDERIALAAHGAEWDDIDPAQPFVIFDVQAHSSNERLVTVGGVASVSRLEDRKHIAQHDPVRVLREVAAKQRIINEFVEAKSYYDENRSAPAGELSGLHLALKAIASVYSDHPDYREEWKL